MMPRRQATSVALLTLGLLGYGLATANTFPITAEQRQTAQRVAQAGVPLSELAANAPDSYTVKPGDTLWAISSLFLKSPWRWPELWGMNSDQISNPHLIYPGQVLLLVKVDGRARLELARQAGAAASGDTVKLSPRVRANGLDGDAISAIPQHLIEPFLTEAVVFDTDELAKAPRIVAAQENRVMLSRGDLAYARGSFGPESDYRVFRQAKPLRDPATKQVLGYEAPYVGIAELTRRGGTDGKTEVPATLTINQVKQEVGVGDRLSPVPPRSFNSYVPHAPGMAVSGQIISIYGDALTAGQNQIVALNRGRRDGMERGHVLALWHAGRTTRDITSDRRENIRLPDERHGNLFVFQVYERVSYALILSVREPVVPGDRFTQP